MFLIIFTHLLTSKPGGLWLWNLSDTCRCTPLGALCSLKEHVWGSDWGSDLASLAPRWQPELCPESLRSASIHFRETKSVVEALLHLKQIGSYWWFLLLSDQHDSKEKLCFSLAGPQHPPLPSCAALEGVGIGVWHMWNGGV